MSVDTIEIIIIIKPMKDNFLKLHLAYRLEVAAVGDFNAGPHSCL